MRQITEHSNVRSHERSFNGFFKAQLPIAFSLVVIVSCAQTRSDIENVAALFKTGKASASEILTSEKYISLHRDPAFRNLIRENAPTGKISIASEKEPGKRITLKGVIVGKDQKPRKHVLFYFYHTMHDGLYTPNNSEQGQTHAKLFGYVRTDDEGKFEISTIKPAGYPGEKFPSHVHLEIYDTSGQIELGTEFQFYDDPRLSKEERESSIRNGNLVAQNSGTKEKPIYFYKIMLPD
jgi:protocatechuate 3,4-dioxygenase, beta subunit